MDWEGGELAIEVHCDAWNIAAEGGSTAQIGILGFMREKFSGGRKEISYIGGILVACTSGERIRISTSIYEWEIQDSFRGFDTSRLTDGID